MRCGRTLIVIIATCLVGALLAGAATRAPEAQAGATATKRCKTVIKKVRKKTKRVRVCKLVPDPRLLRADLSVSAVASASTIIVGQDLQYLVTVRNKGPKLARNVIVAIETPIGLASLEGTTPAGLAALPCPAVDAGPTAFRCLLGELRAGERWQLRFIGVPTEAGELRFAAAVRSATLDPTVKDTAAVVLTTAEEPPLPPPPPPPPPAP